MLVVASLVALGIAAVIAVVVFGATALTVCAVVADPNCNDAPNYSAVTVVAEDGPDGLVLIVRGERNPVLPDSYVSRPLQIPNSEHRLVSSDPAADTFRFAVDKAPAAGQSMPVELRLRFGGRSGIDGCAERGTGMHYDTVVNLELQRSDDGAFVVSDVVASILHYPGYF